MTVRFIPQERIGVNLRLAEQPPERISGMIERRADQARPFRPAAWKAGGRSRLVSTILL
jgi:hypothetical protein